MYGEGTRLPVHVSSYNHDDQPDTTVVMSVPISLQFAVWHLLLLATMLSCFLSVIRFVTSVPSPTTAMTVDILVTPNSSDMASVIASEAAVTAPRIECVNLGNGQRKRLIRPWPWQGTRT